MCYTNKLALPCLALPWSNQSFSSSQLLLSLVQPVLFLIPTTPFPGPTSPFPHPNYSSPWSSQSFSSSQLLLSLVQPVLFLVPTTPLPGPTRSFSSSQLLLSLVQPVLFLIQLSLVQIFSFFVCFVVLYCFEQNQFRECIFIVHGHVWKYLFINIGISYFSIISN